MMNKKVLGIGIGVLVLIVMSFFMFSGNSGSTGNVLVDESNVVKIPLSEISETAKFYEYDGIKYFVIKASDTQGGHENLQAGGSVKTAFDACDVCYRSRKGYRQEGQDMVCNNCGNHYPISGLGTKNLRGGGCWPGYLPSSVEGENLIIKKSDLESGRYRF